MFAKPLIRRALLAPHFCWQRALFSAVQPESATLSEPCAIPATFELDGRKVETDDRYNISPGLRRLFERRLLHEPLNPLALLSRRIVDHFHAEYRKPGNRSPIFTICENEPRLVSVFENFDSLLTPSDHVSRRPSDTYYANREYCLRAHTSAHQFDCLRRGLDNFIVVGDVYRRDEIDRTHFPCFHQMEGLRTFASAAELFGDQLSSDVPSALFVADGERLETTEKQAEHTLDASRVLVFHLQQVLERLARALFGDRVEYRWVDAYFPFTHPSFELEVRRVDGDADAPWLEVLGCGVVRQKILESAGAGAKVGWAFGLGLERLAMLLFGIPDIRLFWLRDSGFLNQFRDLSPDNYQDFVYRSISDYPQCSMDLSFWIPLEADEPAEAMVARLNDLKADTRDVMRHIGGDLIEQLDLIDEFHNKKKALFSHCYRIVYRSHEKVLTKEEVNVVHKDISDELRRRFGVIPR